MFLRQSLTQPSLFARSLHTHLMCPLFVYAAARALVETKTKQDVSSLHRYAVFLILRLTSPSLLARSLYTYIIFSLFHSAAYAAARPLDEAKKKQDISSMDTKAVFLSQSLNPPSLLARSLVSPF